MIDRVLVLWIDFIDRSAYVSFGSAAMARYDGDHGSDAGAMVIAVREGAV